jgi:hypothetical protein
MKKIAELKTQIETLLKEKQNLDDKNQDLFNRLKESLTENSDLVEKIKRFEYMLSLNGQTTEKSGQFNSLNNGINLDYLSLADNHNEEKHPSIKDFNKKNEGKYTINFKLNIKKNHNHNYGINRQINNLGGNELGKKKDILEISETMTQKPLSKV